GQGGARLKQLFPLREGRRVWFVVGGANASGAPASWYETYRVVGRERVQVPAGTFDAWVIDWEEQGRDGSSWQARHRFWFAPELGYFVKFAAAKSPPNNLEDWVATRVVVPRPLESGALAARPSGAPSQAAK